MKSYLKQDNVAPHNFTLFELDFDVKFPLLRLLLFLNDLKNTITCNYSYLPYLKKHKASPIYIIHTYYI